MRATSKAALLAAAAAGAGVAAVRRIAVSVNGARQPAADRWFAVTVYRPLEEVAAGDRLPKPLVELGDRIEVRIQRAPGDKGTELYARLREPGPDGPAARIAGRDPSQRLRLALRQAKSLLETGDVLRPDPPTTHPGPAGRVVRLASRRAGGEGRL